MNITAHKTLYFRLILIVVGIGILIPALRGDFFYDDFDHLDGALRVKHGITTGQGSILGLFKSGFVSRWPGESPWPHYRPGGFTLTYLLISLNGADATVFILFGILIHLIITLIFFKLGLILLQDELKAFWAALLFVCQAWGIQAVIWPGAVIFYLPFALCHILVVLFFIYYLDTKRIVWLLLSAALMLLELTFFEGGNIAIFILFGYYFLTQISTQGKRIWLFFIRPIFYPYYAVILLWIIILAHQNIAARKMGFSLALKNALNPQSSIKIFEKINYVLTAELERFFGWLGTPWIIHLASYAYVLLLIVLFIASMIIFLRTKQPTLRFLLIWLLIEIVPRFMLAGISTRGFYTIAFPFMLILVVIIFRAAEVISKLLRSRMSEIAIATVLLLLLTTNQVIRAESRIFHWINITDYIRSQTNQLFEETGSIGSEDKLILMAPTQQQLEMFSVVDKDNLCKRVHSYLNDPTVEVHYQLFDSVEAVLLAQQPGHHVLVGTLGRYHRYSSDLDISALIPADLQNQYQKYLEQQAKSRRSIFKRKREIDF